MKKSAENLQAQLITTPPEATAIVCQKELVYIEKQKKSLFIIPFNIYKSTILWSHNLIIDLVRDTSHSKSVTKAAVL